MAKDKREAKGQKKKNGITDAKLKMIRKTSRQPFKVTYISYLMKFTTNNLSEFRSLVQKRIGKESVILWLKQLISTCRPHGGQPVHAAGAPDPDAPPEVPNVAEQTRPSGSSNIELEDMFLSEADMLRS